MNCGIIVLFLLLFGQNGCGRCAQPEPECGCERPTPPPCRPRERECECERERECDRGRDNERDGCPCNNNSRFEPRFEPRPFSDAGRGCNDK